MNFESMFGPAKVFVDSSIFADTSEPKPVRAASPPARRETRKAPKPSDGCGNSVQLLCDYDKNPSGIYALLEGSKWNMAVDRCRSHPKEVRTWVIRRDKDNKSIRWKLLPLHAAVTFSSPTFVVEALLEAYPEALSHVDDQGMLPLHLSFRHKQTGEEMIKLLLTHNPKAVTEVDKRGRIPLELANDALFSAKLMKLYASTCSAVSSQTIDRGLLNREAAEDDYNSHLQSLTTVYEGRIESVQRQGDAKLENAHELVRMQKVKLASKQEENRGLMMKVQVLEKNLNDTTAEVDMLKTLLNGTKAYSAELLAMLEGISTDHEKITKLVDQQQDELKAAQSMRAQLLLTLMEQEKDDMSNATNNGEQIVLLMETTRQNIDRLSKTAMPTADLRVEQETCHRQNIEQLPKRATPTADLRVEQQASELIRIEQETSQRYIQTSRGVAGDEISAMTEDPHFY